MHTAIYYITNIQKIKTLSQSLEADNGSIDIYGLNTDIPIQDVCDFNLIIRNYPSDFISHLMDILDIGIINQIVCTPKRNVFTPGNCLNTFQQNKLRYIQDSQTVLVLDINKMYRHGFSARKTVAEIKKIATILDTANIMHQLPINSLEATINLYTNIDWTYQTSVMSGYAGRLKGNINIATYSYLLQDLLKREHLATSDITKIQRDPRIIKSLKVLENETMPFMQIKRYGDVHSNKFNIVKAINYIGGRYIDKLANCQQTLFRNAQLKFKYSLTSEDYMAKASWLRSSIYSIFLIDPYKIINFISFIIYIAIMYVLIILKFTFIIMFCAIKLPIDLIAFMFTKYHPIQT